MEEVSDVINWRQVSQDTKVHKIGIEPLRSKYSLKKGPAAIPGQGGIYIYIYILEVIKLEMKKSFFELEKTFRLICRLSSVKTELVHCVQSMPNKTIVWESQ